MFGIDQKVNPVVIDLLNVIIKLKWYNVKKILKDLFLNRLPG